MPRPCQSVVLALLMFLGWATLPWAGAAETAALVVDAAPERVWQALQASLAGGGMAYGEVDSRRFELRLAPPVGAAAVSVDWDEGTGGTRIQWTGERAEAVAAARPWLEKVAVAAAAVPRANLYCRHGDEADIAEGFLDIAPGEAPDCGIGKFSAALFELEKCGDHESALKIFSACVRQQNSLGMLRLAQHYENGYAVPMRPERMTEYLRRAAEAGTPGYGAKARVQYATALYFGVGVAPDQAAALAIFRDLARRGDADAAHFLAHGYHYAWRRPDGSVYRDPDFRPDRAGR